MSITLRAFVLDDDAYRGVQRSGDRTLAERVITDAARTIAMEDSWASQLRRDHLPIATAIRDIVDGSLRDGHSAALSYNVAALILAEHFGERVDDDALAERPARVQVSIDDAIRALLRAHGDAAGKWPLLADVLTRGPALEIPAVRETLPNGTGLVSRDEVRRAAAVVAEVRPQHDGEAMSLAMVYGGWLVRAAESDRALLLACD